MSYSSVVFVGSFFFSAVHVNPLGSGGLHLHVTLLCLSDSEKRSPTTTAHSVRISSASIAAREVTTNSSARWRARRSCAHPPCANKCRFLPLSRQTTLSTSTGAPPARSPVSRSGSTDSSQPVRSTLHQGVARRSIAQQLCYGPWQRYHPVWGPPSSPRAAVTWRSTRGTTGLFYEEAPLDEEDSATRGTATCRVQQVEAAAARANGNLGVKTW